MRMLIWNVRGLGNLRAVRNLKHEVQKWFPQVMFLSETKCSDICVDLVKRSLGFDIHFAVNSNRHSGGLALFWKKEIDISVRSFSPGHIDSIVNSIKGRWRLTGFYGNPDTAKRRESWDLLNRLGDLFNYPWIIGGDFNEILGIEEKDGGRLRSQAQIEAFSETIDNCLLKDMGWAGDKFTWRRGNRKDSWIRERLDRIFANQEMINQCQNIKIQHHGCHHSDHRAILAEMTFEDNNIKGRKKKVLKFEENWLKHPDSLKIIKDNWNNIQGNDIISINSKIYRCLQSLDIWNRNQLQGSIKGAVERKKTEIQRLKQITGGLPDQNLIKAEKELDSLLEEEEMYWKLRSREDGFVGETGIQNGSMLRLPKGKEGMRLRALRTTRVIGLKRILKIVRLLLIISRVFLIRPARMIVVLVKYWMVFSLKFLLTKTETSHPLSPVRKL